MTGFLIIFSSNWQLNLQVLLGRFFSTKDQSLAKKFTVSIIFDAVSHFEPYLQIEIAHGCYFWYRS